MQHLIGSSGPYSDSCVVLVDHGFMCSGDAEKTSDYENLSVNHTHYTLSSIPIPSLSIYPSMSPSISNSMTAQSIVRVWLQPAMTSASAHPAWRHEQATPSFHLSPCKKKHNISRAVRYHLKYLIFRIHLWPSSILSVSEVDPYIRIR